MSEAEKPGEVTPEEEARFEAAVAAVVKDPAFREQAQAMQERAQTLNPEMAALLNPENMSLLDKLELAAVGSDFLGSTPQSILGKVRMAAEGMIAPDYPDGEPHPSEYKLPTIVEKFLAKVGVSPDTVENYQQMSPEQQAKILETVNAALDALDVREKGSDQELQLTSLAPDQLERLTNVPGIHELYAETRVSDMLNGKADARLAALQERYGEGVAELTKTAVETAQRETGGMEAGDTDTIASPPPAVVSSGQTASRDSGRGS